MKKKQTPARIPESDVFIKGPAYPYTANQVFLRLKEALDKTESPCKQVLMLKELGELIGAPRSTIHDWYHGDLPKPIEHLLCGLERLAENQRLALMRALCRDCPRLNHPRLVMLDAPTLNALSALILQKTGLTFVSGSDEALRTFLITALGNTAVGLHPLGGIAGLDVHRPDLFVPVPGVLYLRNPQDLRVRRSVVEIWHCIENSASPLVLMNGILTIIPELRSRTEELARRKHVVVADQIEPTAKALPNVVTTIVTVTAARNRLVHVSVEAPHARR